MEKTLSGRRQIKAKRGSAPPPVSALAAIMANLRVWLTRIRTRAFWVKLFSPRELWAATTFLFGWLYTALIKLPWIAAIVVIGVIVIQGLTQTSTVINPISVPSELASRGYSPDVAGQRLRDAVADFMTDVHSFIKNPDIALHGELPNIVVPTVGISLDAVLSSLRTLLRSTRSRTVSGEITIKQKQLWLALRLDGQKFYESEKGTDPDKPDELFAAAATALMTEIRPYFVAVKMRREDPERALKFVDDMIAKLPPTDNFYPFFFNTRGLIYRGKKDYAAATEAFQAAIRLSHDRLTLPHANLALVYKDQDMDDKADAEYKRAIELAPKYPLVHFAYGLLLVKQNKKQAAIAEFNKAIALDPDYAAPHNSLAIILKGQDDFNGAIAEYRKAIVRDKKAAYLRVNLGELFRDMGRRDEAIAEFKEALRINPKSETARNELDKLLPQQAATGSVTPKP